MEDTLSYQEAAGELSVTYGSIKQLITNGKLHSIKVPRTKEKRIARAELEHYRTRKNSQDVALSTPTVTATLSETWNTSIETVKRGQVGVITQAVLAHSSNELTAYREMIDRYGDILATHLDKLTQAIGPALTLILEHDVTKEEIETLMYQQRASRT